MYSETDLEAAVSGGVLTADQAAAFRDFIATGRQLPAADDEHFRLLTGFKQIFVGIAATILLVAVGWIGQYLGPKIDTYGPSPPRPPGLCGRRPARAARRLTAHHRRTH